MTKIHPIFGCHDFVWLVEIESTLPETNIAPKNGWLEYYIVSFWDGPFSGAVLVSGRVI